jgi:type II secretory pathway component PulK
MSVASVVAMGAALVGRDAVLAGASRIELERARWFALGCERRAVAAIDAVLRDAPSDADAARAWRILSARIAVSPLVTGCNVSAEAAGTRLDVNAASDDMLRALLESVDPSADPSSMVDALADWRDSDDVARPGGAEQAWYESVARLTPRNAPLADVRELARVRGFEDTARFDTLFGVEPGRVSLATAPVAVLMSVPGITRETAEGIAARRLAGTPLEDLLSIAGSVSEASAESLATHFADASRLTTPDPDAWLVTARVSRGLPTVTVSLAWRVIRTGRRCAVAGTRSDA